MLDIAVIDGDPRASALAQRLGVPLQGRDAGCEFLFDYQREGLSLIHQEGKSTVTVRAEWLHGKAAHRAGQPEMISRALGLKKLAHPHVVDATAGLGRDSVVMAGLGANVTALERSPYVFALLADAHERAMLDASARGWAERIHLCHTDARQGLADVAGIRQIDLVFLDPMYPEKSKKALAKKDMRLFQRLIGKALDDEEALLAAAREHALYRVVVKRPIKGEFLAGQKPSFSIKGRSTRFDVYTNKGLP